MRTRPFLLPIAAAIAAAALALPSLTGAAGPPLPSAANGNPVQVVATGIDTPTSFAFIGKTMFVASGSESGKGGIFSVRPGSTAATHVPGSGKMAFGVVSRKGKLFASQGRDLFVYSKWDGTRFKHRKRIYHGSKRFTGFGGLAFSRRGRLFAGVFLAENADHRKGNTPLAQSIVSMKPNGKRLQVVARGLRQPWQMTFLKGGDGPYVSVLGQDGPAGVVAPDYIVRARRGQDYGFPKCNQSKPKPCRSFAKPVRLFPQHTSPMGIGAIGNTLYVALFGGLDGSPEIVSIPGKGKGAAHPFVTGFVAPTLSLAVRGKTVYFGDLTGTVYKVAAGT